MCTILSIATDQVSKRSNHRHYTQCHQPTSSCLNPRKAPQIHGVQSERPLFSFKSSSNSTSTSSSSRSISHCLQWNPPDDNRIRGMGCPSVLRFSTKPMIWLKKQTDVVGGWELVLRTSAQTSNTSGYGIYVARRSSKGSPLYRKLESFPNTWSWPKTRNRWLCHQKCRLLLRMCNVDASLYWVYYNQPSKSHL